MNQSETRAPRLLQVYAEFLEQKNSACFIAAVAEHYHTAALERLARSGDRVTRRAAVLALGLLGDYTSNRALGRALTDVDRAVRLLAENGLRAVRLREGAPAQRLQLEQLVRLNRATNHDAVLTKANHLILLAPWIAEAWNQRGIAHFYRRRLRAALADFCQTLELNTYHFDAAVGMALCHLEREKFAAALECYERALCINPGLEGVRTQIGALQRTLKRHG